MKNNIRFSKKFFFSNFRIEKSQKDINEINKLKNLYQDSINLKIINHQDDSLQIEKVKKDIINLILLKNKNLKYQGIKK